MGGRTLEFLDVALRCCHTEYPQDDEALTGRCSSSDGLGWGHTATILQVGLKESRRRCRDVKSLERLMLLRRTPAHCL
jgi:hypothetical protein